MTIGAAFVFPLCVVSCDAGAQDGFRRSFQFQRKGSVMKHTEKDFLCPFCNEPMSQVLNLSVNGQICTEYCEICNHRFAVRYSVRNGKVAEFKAQPYYSNVA